MLENLTKTIERIYPATEIILKVVRILNSLLRSKAIGIYVSMQLG